MGPSTHRQSWEAACRLVERQCGVVARWQLLRLGFSVDAVRHCVESGRLHRVARGVYALGRRGLDRRGEWMAAVLGAGPGAVLSHGSAACLWGIGDERPIGIEVSVATRSAHRRPGVVVHRRSRLQDWERVTHDLIPVTNVVATVVDVASYARRPQLERVIREADRLELIDHDALRSALDRMPPRPGIGVLRTTLDRLTFRMTDSELERRFLPLARAAGLPEPETQAWVNGFRVDFFWPDLGLVVETDGLTYHRTPSQQARDRIRDNAHLAAGLSPVRFTHGQVRYDPAYVRSTLALTARRRHARKRR